MTVHANRVEGTDNVKCHFTSGSLTASIEENVGHLRHFWSELGFLLNEVERDVRRREEPADA